MTTIRDIQFYPYDGCPVKPLEQGSGFDVSVSGMNVTIGSGSITDEDGVTVSFASASFAVPSPASGDSCFGIYAHDNGTFTSGYDPQVDDCLITKAVWVYVDPSDVDLSGKTFFRNILP